MIWKMFMAIAFVLFAMVGKSTCSRIEEWDWEFESPRFKFTPENFTRLSGIVQEFDVSFCANDCQGPPDGYRLVQDNVILAITVYETCFFCGYANLALWGQDIGAIGIMRTSTSVPGHEATVIHSFSDWETATERKAIMLEVNEDDLKRIVDNRTNGTIIELYETPNPWTKLFNGPWWILAQIVCAGLNLIVTIFGIRQFSLLYPHSQRFKKLRAPLICISLETISAFIVVIFTSIDPSWSREIFTYQVGRFLMTLPLPFSWLGSILLFLVWRDITRKGIRRQQGFLSTVSSRIFFALGILIFTFDITFSAIAAWQGITFSTQISIALGIINVSIALVFLSFGVKFIITVSGMQNTSKDYSVASETSPSKSKFRKLMTSDKYPMQMTRKLLLAAFFMVVSTLSLMLIGHDQFGFDPTTRTIIFILFYSSLAGLSSVKISAFRPPANPQAEQKSEPSMSTGTCEPPSRQVTLV